ncbi:hypothetical protein NMY22_g5351 [Coprinellus aureogranulatus]|nr:hypothetical protein NMY22_g5351 [Coprinellus aureogranulatus]
MFETKGITIPATQHINLKSRDMPWDMAKKLTAVKTALGLPSSVFVLNGAESHWELAMKCLMKQKIVNNMVHADPHVMFDLVDAIMTDDRIFRMQSDFIEKITLQTEAENACYKGWLKSTAGPTLSKQEFLKRLETETWSTVRPAITFTVRAWVWTAYFRTELTGSYDFAFECYRSALDICTWGHAKFGDLPAKVRGTIFSPQFILGVRRMYLDTLRSAFHQHGKESGITLSDIIDLAQQIIEDANRVLLKASPNKFTDPWFLAFYVYPKASALANIGWCFSEQGIATPEGDPEREASLQTGAEYYLAAAETYPEDDQLHPHFLRRYLECLSAANKPLKEMLPVAKRIRLVIPKALEIWGGPVIGDPLRENLREVTEYETKYTQMVSSGKRTLDAVVPIRFMVAPRIKTEGDTGAPFKLKDLGNRRSRMKDLLKKI